MQRRQSDIDRESVKDVASRLRQFEDHNLAIKLQEEEFNHHYSRNRSERQFMGVDTRKSKEEQELEKKYALEKRLAECREIAARDEAIAKRLQQELEAEELRLKQEQALLDQEIARRMTERYEAIPVVPQVAYAEDERLAREMHEKYLRRMRGLATSGSLDERTRNELESLEAEYRTHNPDSPLFRPSNTSQSEFGLPPFSDIYHSANTISRDRPSTTTTSTPTSPMMNVVQEIRTKISNPNNI